jgi:hypothetical protein
MDTPQCYVIHTLPLLLIHISMELSTYWGTNTQILNKCPKFHGTYEFHQLVHNSSGEVPDFHFCSIII